MAKKHVVKYNKRNKQYVVFCVDTVKKGFGAWKIEKSFPTKKEADAYAKSH